MSRVDRLIYQTTLDRGTNAEDRARRALNQMQERQVIITHWPANWKEDRKDHFDEYIMLPDGSEALVDICSSPAKLVPGVLQLIVKPGETPEEIIPHIVALLGLKLQS